MLSLIDYLRDGVGKKESEPHRGLPKRVTPSVRRMMESGNSGKVESPLGHNSSHLVELK